MMDSSREALKADERGLGDVTCQVPREVSAGSGSDRNRAQLGSWVCLSNLGPSPGARGGTAQPADGRSQPAGRARTGAIADVGSAGFASGCERPSSRSTARLGEAGAIELRGAGATCTAAGRSRCWFALSNRERELSVIASGSIGWGQRRQHIWSTVRRIGIPRRCGTCVVAFSRTNL
jgi:hypothetical protein